MEPTFAPKKTHKKISKESGQRQHLHGKPLAKQQIFEIINRLEPEIRAFGVSRLAVFGSVVRDEQHPDSDIDILVQFSLGTKTFEKFMSLSELLEAHLGQHIDLITTEALSPFIGQHILAEAQDVIRSV